MTGIIPGDVVTVQSSKGDVKAKKVIVAVGKYHACIYWILCTLCMVVIRLSIPLLLTDKEFTVNVERLARLNFHGFHSFEEYHENFPVNIYIYELHCQVF